MAARLPDRTVKQSVVSSSFAPARVPFFVMIYYRPLTAALKICCLGPQLMTYARVCARTQNDAIDCDGKLFVVLDGNDRQLLPVPARQSINRAPHIVHA